MPLHLDLPQIQPIYDGVKEEGPTAIVYVIILFTWVTNNIEIPISNIGNEIFLQACTNSVRNNSLNYGWSAP